MKQSLIGALCVLVGVGSAFAQTPAKKPATKAAVKATPAPAAEVKDAFFAYVLGIITGDMEVDIDGDHLREIRIFLD